MRVSSAICFLIAFGFGAFSEAQDIVIHITGPGVSAKYIKEGDTAQQDVVVYVGQTVRFANDVGTTTIHNATSVAKDSANRPIFATGDIPVGQHADVLFDQAKFIAAGGTPGADVILAYICTRHPATMASRIILRESASVLSLRVRKNVVALSANEIASLRNGIAVMKSRPVSDRTSWQYWANIHGIPGVQSDPLWKQCEHGTLHFLTWHRAYLFYFEQVLRDASGDPNLTLPYWDWSTQRALPIIYREPAETLANPLFELQRQMNDGSMLPTMTVINDRDFALAATTFGGFSNRLDNTPHGAIHVFVGGPGGTMSSIGTSARDPIFWAHHANVDRLWNRWLDQPGRLNPSDSAFLNRQFTLVGADGNNVTIRVADLLDQNSLGYRYDDEPGLVLAMSTPQDLEVVASRVVLESLPDDRTPLGFAPHTVQLAVSPQATAMVETAFSMASPQAEQRVLIDIEDIEFAEVPAYAYGVFWNLPEGPMDPERLQLHYVGSISFFAQGDNHGHATDGPIRFSTTLDATECIGRMRSAGVPIGEANLSVTIQPVTLVAAQGNEAALQARHQASAESAGVKYRDIRIRLEEKSD